MFHRRIAVFVAISAVTILGALVPAAPAQTTWFVDLANCPGPGDGSAGNPFCLIQDAIDAAAGGDDIEVAPGSYLENLNMLGKVITLRSIGGPEMTEINGGSIDTVIRCQNGEGTDTIIDGFTVRNGLTSNVGGGIRCDGSSPTIRNCIIENNQTNGIAFGGAGISTANGSPLIVNCVLRNNVNQGSTGGGAMLVDNASPVVINCTITENQATSGQGGGVLCIFNSAALFENCIIWNNLGGGGNLVDQAPAASTVNYSDISGWGGAGANNISADPRFISSPLDLHVDRYSPCVDAGDNDAVPVTVSVDLDDLARFIDDAGVANTGNGGVLGPPIVDIGAYERQVDSVPVTFNITPADSIQATIDEAFDGDEIIAGPGIYNQTVQFNGKAITLRSSDGVASTSLDGAGLNASVVRCINGEGPDTVLDGFTIQNGTGDDLGGVLQGGGMRNVGSSPTIQDCWFLGNTANEGGAMYNSAASPSVIDCVFQLNDLSAIAGSAGGAVYNLGGAPAFTGCSFSSNKVGLVGGDGGAMYSDGSDVQVVMCSFNEHTAGQSGGALLILDGSASITGSTFSTNSATVGGAIYNDGGNLSIDSCTFSGNTAVPASGGAVFSRDGATNTVTSSVFVDNSSGNIGGAIVILNAPLTLDNCDLFDNQAALHGGSLFCQNGDLTVDDCWFRGNVTDTEGGAIKTVNFGETPEIDIRDSAFEQNSAEVAGAIHNQASAGSTNIQMERCRFLSNAATLFGGAVVNDSSPSDSIDCEFIDCEFIGNRLGAPVTPGDGDTCETSRIMLSDTISGTTADNTPSGVPTVCVGQSSPDEWLQWTSQCDGTVAFVLCGSDPNLGLEIYGGDCGTMDFRACQAFGGCEPSPGNQVSVTHGDEVYIRILGNSASAVGEYELQAICDGIPSFLLGGGAIDNIGGTALISQCTFAANAAPIFQTIGDGSGVVTVDNSVFGASFGIDISNTGTTTVNSTAAANWSGPGSTIVADPLFVDLDGPDNILGTLDDDTRLHVTSPCIDTADNGLIPPGVTTDLNGLPRILDGDLDGNSIVDMGCHEHDPVALSQIANITQSTIHQSIAIAIDAAVDGDALLSTLGPFTFEPNIDFSGLGVTLRSIGGIVQPVGGDYVLADDARLEASAGFGMTFNGAVNVQFGDRVELAADNILIETAGSLTASAASITDFQAAGGVINAGLITLNGGALGAAGGLVNDFTGTIEAIGIVEADVINDGGVNILADTQVIGDYTNNDTTTIQNGVLTILGTLTNNGTIIGDVSNPLAGGAGPSPGMAVLGDLIMGSGATLQMPSPDSVLKVEGEFDVGINDNVRYDLAQAEFRTIGLEGAAQSVERMSTDIGSDRAGLDRTLPGHYPIGTLRIGPAPTTVNLVDLHDNDNLGQAVCEAMYVGDLIIEPGATLNTNGCAVYYETLAMGGAVDDPLNLIQLPAPCLGDTNDDQVVDVVDLLAVLGAWGPNPGHPADVTGDDIVDIIDLLTVLGNWGMCN